MTDDNMKRLNVLVPEQQLETAKARLEHGGISREVRDTIQRIAHGTEVSEREQLKDQLNEWRSEKRELVHDKQAIENEIDELDVKIGRGEDRLDDLRDREGEYEGALQMIEEDMHEHCASVFPGHKKVDHAAELGGCDPTDVITDLKERNPDLPEEQFTVGSDL